MASHHPRSADLLRVLKVTGQAPPSRARRLISRSWPKPRSCGTPLQIPARSRHLGRSHGAARPGRAGEGASSAESQDVLKIQAEGLVRPSHDRGESEREHEPSSQSPWRTPPAESLQRGAARLVRCHRTAEKAPALAAANPTPIGVGVRGHAATTKRDRDSYIKNFMAAFDIQPWPRRPRRG